MAHVTLNVDIPNDLIDQINTLSAAEKSKIASTAFRQSISDRAGFPATENPLKLTWEELITAGTGPKVAEQQKALRAQWVAESAQVADEEPDLATFMANINENRRLSGEEPIY